MLLGNDHNTIFCIQKKFSNDICGSDGIGAQAILCPACERYCDFQRLNNSCVYAKVSIFLPTIFMFRDFYVRNSKEER